MEEPLDNEEFREYILQRAINTSAQEMVQDVAFASRLFKDIAHGKSKSFNRSRRRKDQTPGGVETLYREYLEEEHTHDDG